MSEQHLLYSSYPISFEELSEAILAAGGETFSLEEMKAALSASGHDPERWEDSEYTRLGQVKNGKAYVLIQGSRHTENNPTRFWEENEPYIGAELLREITEKLSGKPVVSFSLEPGHASRSGLLAVELAYQCAIRWPCVVWAEVFEDGNWVIKVYTREDMERLRAEGKAFTDYGMEDEDEDVDE